MCVTSSRRVVDRRQFLEARLANAAGGAVGRIGKQLPGRLPNAVGGTAQLRPEAEADLLGAGRIALLALGEAGHDQVRQPVRQGAEGRSAVRFASANVNVVD